MYKTVSLFLFTVRDDRRARHAQLGADVVVGRFVERRTFDNSACASSTRLPARSNLPSQLPHHSYASNSSPARISRRVTWSIFRRIQISRSLSSRLHYFRQEDEVTPATSPRQFMPHDCRIQHSELLRRAYTRSLGRGNVTNAAAEDSCAWICYHTR